jgi:hypothetical protein
LGFTILSFYLDWFQGALADRNDVLPEVADLKASDERSFRGAPKILFAIFPPLESVEVVLSFSRKSACSTTPKNKESFKVESL